MQKACWRIVSTALAVATAACGGGDGPAGPGPGGSGFTARVNGQDWAADQNTIQVTLGGPGIPGSLTISGTQVTSGSSYRGLILGLSYLGGTGTYPLGVNVNSNAGGIGTVLTVNGGTSETWMTPLSGAAGSVTITTLTATRIQGTFSFVADPLAAGAPVTVTNGAFDLSLPAALSPVPANNYGSVVTATLGASAWNAATIVGLGDLASGSLVLVATTTTHSIQFATTTPVTTGTYTLGNGVNITASQLGTTNAWGSLTGVTGTVTFTSLGNGRARGSFTGTLVPMGTTAGTLSITNGTFDVRVQPAP